MGFKCQENEGGIPLLPIHSSQKLWLPHKVALQSSCQATLLVGLRFVLSVNKYFLSSACEMADSVCKPSGLKAGIRQLLCS